MEKSWWLVLVVPPWTVSTAKVYAHARVPSLPHSPDCFQKALMEDSEAALARAMFNRLEEAALSAYPELQRVRDSVREVAGDLVHLSGSGGTFFVLASSRSEAEALADKISATLIARGMKNVQVHVAATLTADRLRDYRTPRPVDANLSGEGTGAPVNCP
jgi:4-diphosphocytidyl-2-C-methyl-D-erythritol kinase